MGCLGNWFWMLNSLDCRSSASSGEARKWEAYSE